MIHVGVDARPLATGISGVGRIISNVITHFPDKKKVHFHLFSHLPIHEEHKKILELKNVTSHYEELKIKIKGAIYYNIYLPIVIHRYSLDLFWGTQQVVPPFLAKKIKVVIHYHDLVAYKFPETMRKIALFQQRIFLKYSLYRTDSIIFDSCQTRDDLKNIFKIDQKFSIVSYPGYDLDLKINNVNLKFNKEILELKKNKLKFFLTVSTLEPRKNYKNLLEAYKLYRKLAGKSRINWVIAGRIGWENNQFLTDLMENSKQYKDIFLLNNVSDQDLKFLYSNCFLFMLSSKYEGFGIPVLEALAYKKFCLVSDLPVFHEIGGSKIKYLPVNNPEIWAKAMIEYSKMKTLQVSINLKKFTWEKNAKNTLQIFKSTLEK